MLKIPANADPSKRYLLIVVYLDSNISISFLLQMLVATNGIAAVRCILSIRKLLMQLFRNDRIIKFICLTTEQEIRSNAGEFAVSEWELTSSKIFTCLLVVIILLFVVSIIIIIFLFMFSYILSFYLCFLHIQIVSDIHYPKVCEEVVMVRFIHSLCVDTSRSWTPVLYACVLLIIGWILRMYGSNILNHVKRTMLRKLKKKNGKTESVKRKM